MGAFIQAELRAPVRQWPLWLLPPLAALLGWAMLPVNADAYLRFVYDDPQGADQQLEAYHFDVFAVYTSGLGSAQLLAMLAGAYLVLHDPRLTRRLTGPAQPAAPKGPADPGRLIMAKAAVAAVVALAITAVDLAVVLPGGRAQLTDHWVVRELGDKGIAVSGPGLADLSVLTVLVCAATTVPLFALIGIGLAALAGRWWLPAGVVGVLSAASLLFLLADRSSVLREPLAMVLAYSLMLTAVPWAMLWMALLEPAGAPAAAAVTLAFAVSCAVLGYARTRRRLRLRTPPANDEAGG